MNSVKQISAKLPSLVAKLVADPLVRLAAKQAALDLFQAAKSIRAMASAVRAA